MKKIILTLTLIAITAILFAQSPQNFTYQLIARNTDGSLLSNKTVSFRISILEDNATGTVAYAETHSMLADLHGNANVIIGAGTPVTNTFADINWASHSHFLKVELDPAGGTSYTHIRTSEMLSVPYAFYANNIDNATMLAGNGAIKTPKFEGTNGDEGSLRYNPATKKMQYHNGTEWLNTDGTGTVTDYDGNIYTTVKIGNQIWMQQNLKVTHYPDGTPIPLVEDNTAWGNLADNNTDDAYCYYNNNANNEADTYGALYTWAAAMGDNAISSNTNPSGVQGVCPTGWHLPSDAEWTQLTDYLGGESVAGGKMKEAGLLHWSSPNTGADNSSGFIALPNGDRMMDDGTYGNIGNAVYIWSSTESISTHAYRSYINFSNSDIYRNGDYKSFGLSIRCLKD